MRGEWREVTIGDLAPFAYGKGLPERRRNASGTSLSMARMVLLAFMMSHLPLVQP